MSVSSDTPKKEQRLRSKGEQRNDELDKGAETERQPSPKRPRTVRGSVSPHQNYSEKGDGYSEPPVRVGDMAGQPTTNRVVDRIEASRLANLLEGIDFPAAKKQIRNHVSAGSAQDNVARKIIAAIENRLEDNSIFASAYEVELAMGLVKSSDDIKPYVRDRALNRANSMRIGEKLRTDPYEQGQESVGVASKEDVSPNTPRGESI